MTDHLPQALRRLLRRPAPTWLSVALLALAIGLSAAFFSTLDRALLSGLPVPDGDRLVAFSTSAGAGWPMPLEDFRHIEASQRSLEWIYPLRAFYVMVTHGRRTQGVVGSYIPPGLFPSLGIEPILGRGFIDADQDPSNPPPALISHRLWRGSYGGDPEILGQTITINREPSVVVGVMPAGFGFPLRQDVWGLYGRPGRSWHGSGVFGVAKLVDGAAMSDAQRDLERMVAALESSAPLQRERTAALGPFVAQHVGERAQGALKAMVYAALGLLLLTCGNVANLRLGESLRRRAELDTRLALGLKTSGWIKMLLLENLWIGLAASGLGIGLAWVLTETLGERLMGGSTWARAYWVQAGLNLRAVALAIGCGLIASLIGALGPIVWGAARRHTNRIGQSGSTRHRTASWMGGLMSLQIGLCFALLVAAGLWAGTAHDLLSFRTGFDDRDLYSLRMSTYQDEQEDPQHRRRVFERIHNELETRPEIRAAAFASASPWGRIRRSAVAAAPGMPDLDVSPRPEVMAVSVDFFDTLDLEILAGRAFRPDDAASVDIPGKDGDTGDLRAANVAIVSRSLAERLWRSDPLGRTLLLAGDRNAEPRRLRVIGMAEDLSLDRADHEHRNLALYLPVETPRDRAFALVRKVPGSGPAGTTVADVLESVAPLFAAHEELTVDQAQDRAIWVERRLGQIFSLFGGAALAVTAVGIYAVILLMVRSRERELGIRAAVGARPWDLQQWVLKESGRRWMLGVLLGSLLLWTAWGLLDPVLVEDVEIRWTHWLPALLIVGVGCLVGSWGPAKQASESDPARCLSSL